MQVQRGTARTLKLVTSGSDDYRQLEFIYNSEFTDFTVVLGDMKGTTFTVEFVTDPADEDLFNKKVYLPYAGHYYVDFYEMDADQSERVGFDERQSLYLVLEDTAYDDNIVLDYQQPSGGEQLEGFVFAADEVNEFDKLDVTNNIGGDGFIYYIDKGVILSNNLTKSFTTTAVGNKLDIIGTGIDFSNGSSYTDKKEVKVNKFDLGTPVTQTYDFENGVPGDFNIVTGAELVSPVAHTGFYSLGGFNGQFKEVLIEPSILQGNDRFLQRIVFWYYEGGNQSGFGIRFHDKANTKEIFNVGSNNPQWEVDYSEQLHPGFYETWTRVEVVIVPQENGQAKFYVAFSVPSVTETTVITKNDYKVGMLRLEGVYGNATYVNVDDFELTAYD